MILHQTYKTGNLPSYWIPYRDSWIENKVGDKWDYRFYLDNNLRDEVKDQFPQFIPAYDSFNKNIERVDFARYAILYHYGGVYADLDMEQIKSFKPLVELNKAVLSYEPVEHGQLLYKRNVILCNAMMVSNPGNPYWISLMEFIVSEYKNTSNKAINNPVYTTGPLGMSKHFESIIANNSQFTVNGKTYNLWEHLVVLPTCCFYSELYTKNRSRLCPPNQEFAIHHWTGEWTGFSMSTRNMIKAVVRNWRPFLLTMIILILLVLVGSTIGLGIVNKKLKKESNNKK